MFRYKGRDFHDQNSRDEVIDYLLETIVADLSALTAAADATVVALADLAAKVAAGDVTAQGDIDAITAKLVAAVAASDPAPVAAVVGDVAPAAV